MLQQCWNSMALDMATVRSGMQGAVVSCQSLCCFGKEWMLEFGSGVVVVFLYILASQFHATEPCWWWLSLGSCFLVLLWFLGDVRHVLIQRRSPLVCLSSLSCTQYTHTIYPLAYTKLLCLCWTEVEQAVP